MALGESAIAVESSCFAAIGSAPRKIKSHQDKDLWGGGAFLLCQGSSIFPWGRGVCGHSFGFPDCGVSGFSEVFMKKLLATTTNHQKVKKSKSAHHIKATTWILGTLSIFVAAGCATPASSVFEKHDEHTQGSVKVSADPSTQHIAWMDLDDAAITKAKNEDKLILISVYTSWCHWCHVMDEETWSDPAMIDLVNTNFVPVRVDADARPDVAERYADWAWPATGILTSSGQHVDAVRGFQSTSKFAPFLQKILDNKKAGLPLVQVAKDSSDQQNQQDSSDVVFTDTFRKNIEQLSRYYDDEQGGWGKKQKYPLYTPIHVELWHNERIALQLSRTLGQAPESAQARKDLEMLWQKGQDHVDKTLSMQENIIDPVFGGMYQYSTDGDWLHPHYEKLADIQAQAILMYAEAARFEDDPVQKTRWLADARKIITYVERFLTDPAGGFYANQDADLGTRKEAEHILGKEYYNLDEKTRLSKGIPFIDRHIYAAHNGKLIQSITTYIAASGDITSLALAEKAANQVWERNFYQTAVLHDARPSKIGEQIGDHDVFTLADQVYLGAAFLSLFETTGNTEYLKRSQSLATFVVTYLRDGKTGALHTSVPVRQVSAQNAQNAQDSKTPTTLQTSFFAESRLPFTENTDAARWLLRLNTVHEDKKYTETADAILRYFGNDTMLDEQHRLVGSYTLALLEKEEGGVHLTVVGKNNQERAQLHRAALSAPVFSRVVEVMEGGEQFPDIGKPALYVCGAGFCSMPIFAAGFASEAALQTTVHEKVRNFLAKR